MVRVTEPRHRRSFAAAARALPQRCIELRRLAAVEDRTGFQF
jgi:hypothetical protein